MRRRCQVMSNSSSTVHRGVARRPGGSITRLRQRGEEPCRLLQFDAEHLPIGDLVEPGHRDDGRSKGGVPLHIPGEGIAVAHEDVHMSVPCYTESDSRRRKRQHGSASAPAAESNITFVAGIWLTPEIVA